MTSLRDYIPDEVLEPSPAETAARVQVIAPYAGVIGEYETIDDIPAPVVETETVDETTEHAAFDAGPMPYNAVTREHYSGGNIVRLVTAEVEHGYGTGGWAGYGQWQTIGRQVRKGERSTMIATVGMKADENGNVRTFPGKPRRVFHFDQTAEVAE